MHTCRSADVSNGRMRMLIRMHILLRLYFASNRGAKYCDQCVCMFVCLFICLPAHVSQNTHLYFISFLYRYMIHVAMTRSFSDGSAVSYVLPVLWTMSCFHIMNQVSQNQRRCISFVKFSR